VSGPSNDQITLGVGASATCTIVNDDIAPTLTLVKKVINDSGGSATADEWKLAADGEGGIVPTNGDVNEDGSASVGPADVKAGITYTLAESEGPAGYAASAWDCKRAVSEGDPQSIDLAGDTHDQLVLGLGDNVTCTITNDDRAATLIVKKHVINDNGGTKGAADFTLSVDGGNPNPASFAGNEEGTSVAIDSGSYSVSEGAHAGYAQTFEGDCSGTIAAGETKTCTVVNDDIQPRLTVIKHVINNNGRTAVASDFTMQVTGSSPSPASFPGNEGGTAVALNAGAYSVDEVAVANYTETKSAGCSGTLAAGDSAVCTITNDDTAQPPSTPTPPPPPPVVPTPPAPKIDLQITKADSPDPDVLGTQVRYLIVVKNNGPDTAHNVQMSDPLPFQVTFSSVATTQGTCTGGQLISCQLGTIANGASVTITVFVKTNQTGLVTNTATTVGNEAETNTANNTASTTTLVKGPFTPPAAPTGCYAVAVAPHSLTAGKRSTLVLSVHMLGKPAKNARVKVTGAGISKTSGPTNAQGLVRMSVKPAKPGILKFQPVAHKGCALPRIGVIGAFTPPVTG
jgi:uncharacterized repeat protein (TIGR01451 family)